MSEYLSKDILEEGYVRSFAPFRLVQLLLGSCRVDARDLFVTPPTIWQKIYSILLAIVTLCLFYMLIVKGYSQVYKDIKLYNLAVFACVFDYLVYFGMLLHVRFCFSDKNIKFFMKLQEIDRKLNVDGARYLNDFIFKINIATLSVSFAFHVTLFVFSVLDDYEVTFYGMGEFISQAMCTTEWMHFSNIILFFYSRIFYINSIIMNHLNLNHVSYDKTYHFILLNHDTVLALARKTNDFDFSDVVECLNELFDALRIFTFLYRFQMFLFCLKNLAHTIIFVQFVIMTIQANLDVTREHIFLPFKWLSNIIILLFVCLRWEKFFGEIQDTKHLCTKVIASHKGPISKKAARIIKIIEETPPVFSVYDMWNMDASLLLKMFNIMTSIIITLLQFALLK